MSKVTSLRGLALVEPGKPDERIIEAAHEILKLAEEGRLQGVAAIAQTVDGRFLTWNAGPFEIETMVGHLHRNMLQLLKISQEQEG